MTKSNEFDLDFVRGKDDYNRPAVRVHWRQMPNRRADFAMRMMEKFGLLLADAAGEDSAGRQKGRRLSPKECAELAVETSDHLFNEMETRGWFTELPSLDEIEDIIEERENKKENGGLSGRRKK